MNYFPNCLNNEKHFCLIYIMQKIIFIIQTRETFIAAFQIVIFQVVTRIITSNQTDLCLCFNVHRGFHYD